MKISQSLVPELVWYKHFDDCTIRDAILYSLQHAKNNTLSLVDIWKIKVNWNRLLWSYGDAIRDLRKQWYRIEMKMYHHPKKKITCVTYRLENPTHNPDWSEQFNNI